jgi:hypothetical protein
MTRMHLKRRRTRGRSTGCAGHPAVLCYTIGNEIPASIVRWSGRRRTERFIRRLYQVAKAEDPEGLVTYVNFPTTEYLQLPFLDFCCFNVYLESQDRLQIYLARLQNIAGDRPLVMAEIGLDSRRNGLGAQASALDWQIRTAFASGCAGVFAYSWTDEWYGEMTSRLGFADDRDCRPSQPAAVGRLDMSPRDLACLVSAWCAVTTEPDPGPMFESWGDSITQITKLSWWTTDPRRHWPPSRKHSVRFIRVKTEASRARNIGPEAATGEIIALSRR